MTDKQTDIQTHKNKTLCFQANGKCYGDAVYLMSPGNDTISLCGNRDGLSLKLQDYKDNLSVAFKSLNKSSFPGFSCRLKWGGEEVEDVKIEHTELLKGEFNSGITLGTRD